MTFPLRKDETCLNNVAKPAISALRWQHFTQQCRTVSTHRVVNLRPHPATFCKVMMRS